MKKTLTTVVATILLATLTTSPIFGQNFTSRATIEQNFCGNSVIVVMERGVDGMNLFSGRQAPSATFVATTADVISTEMLTATAFDNFEMSYVRNLTYIPREAGETDGPRRVPRLLNEETFKQIVLLRLPYDNKQNVLDVIEQLRFMPGVYYAEPNYFFESASIIPNDPQFHQQWGMQNIQAPQAWGITTGTRDVKVGVIDIGFQAHTDLNANWVDGWCFYSNQVLTLSNLGNTLPHPAAQVGSHGNHVAGIIGAIGDNGIGVAGVAWEVSLVPFEVFVGFGSGGQPVGNGAWQVQAVTRATAEGIPVINMSMDGGDNGSMRNAIQNFGGLFVWAAGNAGSNNDINVGPNMDNRLVVGALAPDNTRAGFSCYGARTVEIWAPGANIMSTVLNNGIASKQGTSMAAPHVAGVAALLLCSNPDLTGAQLKEFILEGAEPITIEQPATNPGQHQSRQLNAFGALEALGATATTAPIFENFEETDGDALPNYWRQSGNDAVWRTIGGHIEGVTGAPHFTTCTEPRTGTRQMARTWHNTGSSAWAFSEAVMLTEGTTYLISFWYKAPGYMPLGEVDNFRVQIGTSRNLTGTGVNAQMAGGTTILMHHNQWTSEWTRASIRFTPTRTRRHHIGFQCRTTTIRGGWLITIDDVSIVPIHNIVLNEMDTHIFPSAVAGYDPQTPFNVTIENITNEPTSALTITLSGDNASSFTLSTATLPSIAGEGTANFTIVPNTGLTAGTYIANVAVTGENNTSASFYVRFTVSDPTSIVDLVEDGNQLQVWPNPVTGKLQVTSDKLQVGDIIEIFDMNGRRVFAQPTCNLQLATCHFTIDISHLPNGNYILRIGNSAVQIVKQ